MSQSSPQNSAATRARSGNIWKTVVVFVSIAVLILLGMMVGMMLRRGAPAADGEAQHVAGTAAPTPLLASAESTAKTPRSKSTHSAKPKSAGNAEATDPVKMAEEAQHSGSAEFVGQPLITPAGRSALPAPGEKIKKPLPARRLEQDATAASATGEKGAGAPGGGNADTAIVPWDQAYTHVGETITVEGKIVLTRNTGSVCFLNFSTDYKGKFYVILFADTLNSFPAAPEVYFKGKTIRVQGEVTLHKGAPQMQVSKAAQVKVVP